MSRQNPRRASTLEEQSRPTQSEQTDLAMQALLKSLGESRLLHLAELIETVQSETGYGDITIVIADRRVVRLKAERSY